MQNLTYEQLQKIIKEISDDIDKENNNEMSMFQYCYTAKGIVERKFSNNLNICNSPDCKNCREFDNVF